MRQHRGTLATTRCAGVLVAFLAGPVQAQSLDVLLNCPACHSLAPDRGAPVYPVLNGQPARYLIAQLEAFRTGARQHPQMQATARALGREGAIPMVRMYADAPVPDLSAPPDAEDHANAQAIATSGAWDRGIAPCASCHAQPDDKGPVDMSARAAPRIHGQPESYLAGSLIAYADGSRQTDGMNRMQAYASALSDAEIAQLAAYFAAFDTKEDDP